MTRCRSVRHARRARPALGLLAALIACDAPKGTGSDSGAADDGGSISLGDGGDEGDGDCGESTPVISQGPFCRYLGLIQPEGAAQEMAAIEIWAVATDADGDLHYQAVRTWFDGEPLGEIDTETAAFDEKDRAKIGEYPCQKDESNPSNRWFLNESRVEWEAMYDWGISVQDAAGHWSEMAIVTCPAPTAEGEEP